MMTNSSQNGLGATEPSQKRRVNITIYPKLHDRAQNYAEERGTNFSSLVAQSLYAYMSPGGNSAQQDDIRSVVKRLDELNAETGDMDEKLDQIIKLAERVAVQLGPAKDHIADQIEDELKSADHPLSIPDLSDRLSLPPSDAEAGLRVLEEQFVVQRSDSKSKEDEITRWKLQT